MASKWDVNNAVKASTMPPPRRLIMFALSDVADPKTAVIPEDRTPCLRELSEWTGLNKSTVTRHLDALDEDGWVIRDRPERDAARRDGVRTKYRLDVPRGAHNTTGRGVESTTGEPDEDGSVVQTAPSQAGQAGQDAAPGADDRGAQNTTTVVHPAPTPVVHPAPVPYTDEVTNDKTSSTSENASKPKRRPSKPKSPSDRPDVERICEHLADRLVANGCKRPTITKDWRDAARLMLDNDGRTEAKVIRCIDWATSNHFWRKNILSMPTLRKQYDRLRMAAEEERERANGRASPQRPGTVEHNGMHLKPETIADLERRKRFEAIDPNQLAIGGPG